MGTTILNYLIGIAFTIISAVVTKIIIPEIANWLSAKTDNQRMQTAINDMLTTVETTVNFLEQTVVSEYKYNGNWNTETQKQVLETAIDEICISLTDLTKNTIDENGADIRNTIRRYVESYINKSK